MVNVTRNYNILHVYQKPRKGIIISYMMIRNPEKAPFLCIIFFLFAGVV